MWHELRVCLFAVLDQPLGPTSKIYRMLQPLGAVFTALCTRHSGLVLHLLVTVAVVHAKVGASFYWFFNRTMPRPLPPLM